MPKIVEEGGFRGMIWPNDHEPAHVHLYKEDSYAVVNVAGERAAVRESTFGKRDTKKALKIAEKHRGLILKRWKEIHGQQTRNEDT